MMFFGTVLNFDARISTLLTAAAKPFYSGFRNRKTACCFKQWTTRSCTQL